MIDRKTELLTTEFYPTTDVNRAVRVLLPATQRSPNELYIRYVQLTKDNQLVETGSYDYRHHPDMDGENHLVVCFSSQIGCEQGCPFCASGTPIEAPGHSGKVRLIRNLTEDEIIDQVKNVIELTGAVEDNSRILLSAMGMGEPLANFDNLLLVIEKFKQLWPNRSRLTISTICREKDVEKIKQLAKMIGNGKFAIPVKMHFSLHCPDNETRRNLVPAGISVQELLDIAYNFAITSKTRTKLNYILIQGQNDSRDHANKLAQIVTHHPIKDVATIKISEMNPWAGYEPSDAEIANIFERVLRQAGLQVSRFSSAVDQGQVVAGCGMFRKRALEEPLSF